MTALIIASLALALGGIGGWVARGMREAKP